ncbi:hypothetical protein [Amycolatopsis sp. cmx-4-68]|uniref:hypothetical protein n=1 Tax=Amycolatopsis sp. cmx-4-68 TaxID=2790938 RepID=UPI003979899D
MNVCSCGKPAHATLCTECTREVVTHLRTLATGGVLRIRVHQKRVHVPAVLDDAGETTAAATVRVEQEFRTDSRPGLYELLIDTLARRDHTGNDSIGAVAGASKYEVDFHGKAAELKDTIDELIITWTADVAARNGRPITATTVRGAAAWLAAEPKLIAAHPDAAKFADQLHKVVRSAWKVIDRAPDKVFLGQCGGDQLPCEEDVYALPGQPVVQCRACGAIWDVAERRDFLLSKVDEQLATPPEITRALAELGLNITVDVIYGHIHRGHLTRHPPHPLDARARPRYRVGDVRDILNTGTDREAS